MKNNKTTKKDYKEVTQAIFLDFYYDWKKNIVMPRTNVNKPTIINTQKHKR
jgi:hypothetical protein